MAKVSLIIRRDIDEENIDKFLNEYGLQRTPENISKVVKTMSYLLLKNSLEEGTITANDFQIFVDGK